MDANATFFGISRFNNFLLIDAIDWSRINNNHHRIFFDVSLYPFSFSANTPFKGTVLIGEAPVWMQANGHFELCILNVPDFYQNMVVLEIFSILSDDVSLFWVFLHIQYLYLHTPNVIYSKDRFPMSCRDLYG